jgi:mannitol-1-phosphate/altronate dehydrogenase
MKDDELRSFIKQYLIKEWGKKYKERDEQTNKYTQKITEKLSNDRRQYTQKSYNTICPFNLIRDLQQFRI